MQHVPNKLLQRLVNLHEQLTTVLIGILSPESATVHHLQSPDHIIHEISQCYHNTPHIPDWAPH